MIFLDEKDTPYILDILNKQPDHWLKQYLLDKINKDIQRKTTINSCGHEFYKYTGTKTECPNCKCMPEIEWQLNSKSNYEYPDKLEDTKEGPSLFSSPSETETL
jgi:hypothetical protein